MGRYDSIKHPYQYRMSQWAAKKSNDHQEKQAKSIPCHVTKVDKDFIYVAFENQNNISTLPTVKIPQSWSQFSREPTQKGDKGYAVPGNYYLGGVTGDSGGNTDFYPRGNLTTLSFNGVSHKDNPTRDYDQHTHMGGPNGWIVGTYQKNQQDQQQQQQQNQAQTSLAQSLRTSAFRAQQTKFRKQLNLPSQFDATTSGTSSTSGSGQDQQQQQNSDKTNFSFDKDGTGIVQSKDADHIISMSQKDKKAYIKVPTNEKVYLGGDGKEGQYCKVSTQCGLSINVYARVG
jgi:hypothetical protein